MKRLGARKLGLIQAILVEKGTPYKLHPADAIGHDWVRCCVFDSALPGDDALYRKVIYVNRTTREVEPWSDGPLRLWVK